MARKESVFEAVFPLKKAKKGTENFFRGVGKGLWAPYPPGSRKSKRRPRPKRVVI